MVGERRAVRIRYSEGSWFAIPLTHGGYGLGLVARGSFATRNRAVPLGYFFGPRHQVLPTERETRGRGSQEAVLISWFSPTSIVRGEWPVLNSTSAFKRREWPVPKFMRRDPLNLGNGWTVEYGQDIDGGGTPMREIYGPFELLQGLPEDRMLGHKAVVIVLDQLLAR